MNFNLKRHKTLMLLSAKRIMFESGQTYPNFILGVDFEDLQRELNSNRNDCEVIFAPLYDEKEVEFTNVGVKGLYLTQKGLASFSQKKYIKESNNILLNALKNFVQIVIPILSLIITIMVIIKDDLSTKKELQRIEQKVQLLQKNINKLETKKLKIH